MSLIIIIISHFMYGMFHSLPFLKNVYFLDVPTFNLNFFLKSKRRQRYKTFLLNDVQYPTVILLVNRFPGEIKRKKDSRMNQVMHSR